jgi:hypothetical protein
VAIPITQGVDDPIATPISRRRSARINEFKDSTSQGDITESLTRSESERRWREFTRVVMASESTRAWRAHIRNFDAEQEAKLKMAEEVKSKKNS